MMSGENMSKRTRREESRLRIKGEIADHTSMIDDQPDRMELAPISADQNSVRGR
jgi:hypothetical protein